MTYINRRRFLLGLSGAAGLGALNRFDRAESAPVEVRMETPAGSITDIEGIKVGHFTDTRRPTGCTVILAESSAVGGVEVRGGGPATRETALLESVNMVQKVNAIVLSGGSAFGLDAATGVMRYLEENDIGFPTSAGKVPIVPAASIFDLPRGDNPSIRPDASAGYAACEAATTGPVAEGSVGAGAGAAVGGGSMKGGLGTVCFSMPNGLKVGALVVVNAGGDIYDPETGQIIAGRRSPDGKGFVSLVERIKTTGTLRPPRPGENTTIGVIVTNATLTKTQANRIAQIGHDGLARAINPAHLQWDGDTLFTLATDAHPEPPDDQGRAALFTVVSVLAAEAVSDAIVRAVRMATGLPGLPAYQDYIKNGDQ